MSSYDPVWHVVGIDTATRAGSVAVVEVSGDAPPTRVAEVAHEEELRHAETLLPNIDDCLERAGITLTDVHGFAVSIGPGSFTGLRVGLATAKGLAFATGAWLIDVPTLQAYAHACPRRAALAADLVFVCLDARKGEVYSALFALAGPGGESGVRRVLDEAVEGPDRAVRRLVPELHDAIGQRATLRVVGDGAERYADQILSPLRRHLTVETVPQASMGRGVAVAELGLERFRSGGPADLARLAPAYLRASEAELRLRERRPGGSEAH